MGDEFYIDTTTTQCEDYKLCDNRCKFELKLIIGDYVQTEPKYEDIVKYIYAIVSKYIVASRKESFKPKALKCLMAVFDINTANKSDADKICFISLHITFLFVRTLSNSWYNADIGKGTHVNEDEFTYDVDSILDINKNITVAQLIGNMVDELERTHILLFLTKFTDNHPFDTVNVECFLFKIFKLIEKSSGGDSFVTTKIVTKAPESLGLKPSKFSIVQSKVIKRTPGVIAFGVSFCQPIYFWENNYGVSTNTFIFHTKKVIAKNVLKRGSVFQKSYIDTLRSVSSVKFYVDNYLFKTANDACMEVLKTLKFNEVGLNSLYKEHVENNRQKLEDYLGLLTGNYPENWIKKQKSNIDFLKKRGASKKIIDSLELVFDKKWKNISLKMSSNTNYISDEISSIKQKIEKITNSIKIFEDRLDDVVKELIIKLNNINQIKLTNYNNTNTELLLNSMLPEGVVDDDKGIVDGCNDYNNSSIKNTKTLFFKKNKEEVINIKYINDKFKEEQSLYESYKKTSTILLSKIQKHQSHTALINLFIDYYNFIKTNKIDYIYFSTFGDFRGRIYYASNVSPQSNCLFRFLYHFGIKHTTPTIIIPDFVQKNNKILDMFKEENINIATVHIIFSIGIMFKDKLISKTETCIYFEEIIKLGIVKYKEFVNKPTIEMGVSQFSDIKKILELNYYINIIRCVNSNIYKGYYIIKDTTASFAQHIGIACGFKENSLKYVNLDNEDCMYDTYHVIINHLKKYLNKHYSSKKNNVNINKLISSIDFLDRNLLKNTIMTINYGIGIKNSFKNFKLLLQNLPKDYFSDDIIKNTTILSNLEDSFYYIFNSIKRGDVFKDFYKNNIVDVRLSLLENNMVKFDDITMYNEYYHNTSKHIEIRIYSDEVATIGKKYNRYTLNRCVSQEDRAFDAEIIINKNKTETACWVNLIHMLDAKYLRDIISLLNVGGVVDVFSLHDGWAVCWFDVDSLLIAANSCVLWNLEIGLPKNENALIGIKNKYSYSIVV